jgi:hypothetical protein
MSSVKEFFVMAQRLLNTVGLLCLSDARGAEGSSGRDGRATDRLR